MSLCISLISPGSSSPPNSIEDGYYEDAENNYPTTQVNGRRKNSCKQGNPDAINSDVISY